LSTDINQLIERLPHKERHRLLALSEPVTLALSQVLSEAGSVTDYVYFPTAGFISLVAVTDGSSGVEVGMVGREGMLGIQAVLGVAMAPLHSLVQGAGTAWRIDITAFQRELLDSPVLQSSLQRYMYVLMVQLATSAACLRFHLIGQRLARWLLMTQDRACSDHLHVTHEFLAYMLGVRRVGITTAASALQRAGLIEYQRGSLIVLDRAGLEAAACSCYAAHRHTYTDLLERQ